MKSCLCGALTKKGVWEAMHQLAGVNDAFRVKMEETRRSILGSDCIDSYFVALSAL